MPRNLPSRERVSLRYVTLQNYYSHLRALPRICRTLREAFDIQRFKSNKNASRVPADFVRRCYVLSRDGNLNNTCLACIFRGGETRRAG